MAELETFGRISYIDPTNVSFYSNGAKAIVPSNDLMMNPLEDFCIAVDLEVIIPDRKACSVGAEEGGFLKLNYSSTNGTISFMNGTSGTLTTNFTDINPINPTENTKECLGIESIHIQYQSWFAPEVTIKFVDVRGGSVLSPEEEEYQNRSGVGSVYRALFNLPSPIFKLKVKGFYGHGVTYYLVEEKVDIDLDSSSGNFNITANFIGQMYRVYADIPMVYLCAAPFMSVGQSYWQAMVDGGVFVFKNKSGTETPMIKFPELRERIARAAYNQEKISAAAKGEQMETNNQEKVNNLVMLRETYPLKDWYIDNDGCYGVYGTDTDRGNIRDKIKAYIDVVSAHDVTYRTSYLSEFQSLIPYASRDGKIERETLKKDKNVDAFVVNGKPAAFNDYVNKTAGYKDKVNLFTIKGNTFRKEREFIASGINASIKACEDEKARAKAEYDALVAAAIEKALGFTPSIQNIYNLAFAHMDTFMHAFYEHMDTIKSQLNNHDAVRKKNAYSADDTDVNIGEVELPPYPAFYNDVKVNGETRRELLWPEDMSNGSQLEEVRFIKDLLNASALYMKAAAEANKNAEEIRKDAYGKKDLTGAPSTSVDRFIPVTVNDFVKKNGLPNPYEWVKNADSDKTIEDSKSFDDAVIGTFVLRALHYLSTNQHLENAQNRAEDKMFGKLEAANFIKCFGRNYYSSNFYDFIERYADDKSERKDTNTAIDALFKHTSNQIWNFGSKQLLLETNDGRVIYNLGNLMTFPVGTASFPEIQKDITNAKTYSDKYIAEDWKLDNLTDGESFFVFDSRDYISEVYSGIEALEEDEDYNIDPGNIKKFKDNFDSTYGRDDLTFVDDCVYEIRKDGDYRAVNGGSLRETFTSAATGEYFVRYPTMIDESRKDSLFDEPYYLGQSFNTSKAYLFLLAMPIKRKDNSRFGNGNIPLKCENGVDVKAALLREGALYWRANYMAKHKVDPINTNCGGNKYKSAAADELYMVHSFWDNKKKETLQVLGEKENGEYIKFSEPYGCTDSRKRVLAKMFEDWANTSFAEIETIIRDKRYYNKEDFKEGINPNAFKNDGSIEGVNQFKLNSFLNNTFFSVSTIFDYYAGRPVTDTVFSTTKDELKKALREFMETLEKVYKAKVKAGEEATSYAAHVAAEEDPFNNKDLRLSTYMTVKNLYDRWFVAPFKGRETWEMKSPNSDFATFQYIDSFYHDIGRDITVNISKVGEWLSSCVPSQNLQTTEGSMSYNGRSLYEYIADVAQHTGGILFAFPQRIGGRSKEYLADMFQAKPFNSNWETDESTYVFMYTYKPSEHLGNGEFMDDGFDIPTEQTKTLMGDNGFTIPAFGVSYAKQNQSYFKNLTLNTSNPAITEASIKATMAIAAKGGEGIRETSLFGQDLYRVKTNYAYQCEFDMMGCMGVMPLMYFQLNNVPFWRGAYTILKVSHDIKAGDMTTHVVGQRVNKYSIPLTNGEMINLGNDYNGNDTAAPGVNGGSGGGYTPSEYEGEVPNYARENNLSPNDSVQIKDEVDFDDSNVTEEKPIICLTPAHGPQTGKGSEWFWSRKLIDMYIIPKLKKLTFFDGTSYAKNIQRCNKDNLGGYDAETAPTTGSAKHTGSNGYSLDETRNLTKKYGSKKVISVVPHWNGAGGTYFTAFDGYDKGAGIYMRGDSYIFADMFREEAQKAADRGNNHEFKAMPVGMMKLGSLKQTQHHILGPGKNDGAVQLDCACVLTENFFADYYDNGKKADYSGVLANISKYAGTEQGWSQRDSGRYLVGEGWLLSDEGMTVISDIHVEAIRRYINNLHTRSEMMAKSGSLAGSDISEGIFERCAAEIGCEVEALKAVVMVESGGRKSFIAPGKPPILFEGHVFWRNLSNPKSVSNDSNKDILYEKWTKKFYEGGLKEYDRLERAKKIDETAALKAASWGALQILGENYKACGCSSVQEFVEKMCSSADEQMILGTKFINSDSRRKNALIKKDWATFALYYNGKGYAENQYDKKLQNAYNKIKNGKA